MRSSEDRTAVTDTTPSAYREVRLARWINEPLPDVHSILSGREISRLTRRPRWLLFGLACLGRFPKRRTHCGKPIGWHRADVLDWLTQHMTIEPEPRETASASRHPRSSQACLPLEPSSPCTMGRRAQRRRATHGECP